MKLRFSKIITRSFPGFLRLAERAWKWHEEQRSLGFSSCKENLEMRLYNEILRPAGAIL